MATTNSSAAGNLYQVRMGPNSNTKAPETHNLNGQTSLNGFEQKRRCYTMVNNAHILGVCDKIIIDHER